MAGTNSLKRRRLLVAGGAWLALAWKDLACAQTKQPQDRAGKPARVGILSETTPAKDQAGHQRFVDEMKSLGWVEGRNVVYERYYADDDLTGLPAAAVALVARGPDVIFVRNTQPVLAVAGVTRTIPIVFTGVSDPDQRGLVKSLSRPGGNVTGTTPIGSELGGKRLQLVKQALPALSRIGVLVNPTYSPVSSKDYKVIQEAASKLGVTVVPAIVSSAGDLDAAFALLAKGRAEAVLNTQNPLFNREGKRIVQLATAQRIPVIGTTSSIADEGALISYGGLASEQYRGAAAMVDKILKGAKVGDIPVEQPTKFELVVNLKTAKALRITISQLFLANADRVIE